MTPSTINALPSEALNLCFTNTNTQRLVGIIDNPEYSEAVQIVAFGHILSKDTTTLDELIAVCQKSPYFSVANAALGHITENQEKFRLDYTSILRKIKGESLIKNDFMGSMINLLIERLEKVYP